MNKICFIVPSLDIGGIENYLLRFLRFLPNREGVTVLVRNDNKGDLCQEYEAVGVQLHYQRIGHLNPQKSIALYNYFKDQKFHTVCDFNGNFSGITMLIASFAGVANRITFYRRSSDAFEKNWFKILYNKLLNLLVYRYSTKILSNSQHAIEYFFQYKNPADSRFKIIRNGVDPEMFKIKEGKREARKFFNLPQDKFIVGHVGRFNGAKNHITIFRVAQRLKLLDNEIIFLFAGKDTDGPSFKKQVKGYGIEDICICLGLQTQMPLIYKTMDLFYYPSITEGQPNALIEAMISGLPILASDIPPIKECYEKSYHNQLIDPNDVMSATQVIKELYLKPSLLAERIYKERATKKFELNSNFELFQRELI